MDIGLFETGESRWVDDDTVDGSEIRGGNAYLANG